MRYLLLLVFTLSLGACQDPKIETLKAEKAGLVLLYEKEAEKTAQLFRDAVELQLQALDEATRAKEAEARAILAQEEALKASRIARLAQAEAENQKAAFEKCKSGK